MSTRFFGDDAIGCWTLPDSAVFLYPSALRRQQDEFDWYEREQWPLKEKRLWPYHWGAPLTYHEL